MRLPKTVSENSFDINFCIFIFCQLYVLLEFKYFLVVSAVLTAASLFICVLGILYIIQLKRLDPEREIFFDISKNLFLPTALCITWYILYDAYAAYNQFMANFYQFQGL